VFVNEGDDEEEVFEAPNVGDVMLLVDDDDKDEVDDEDDEIEVDVEDGLTLRRLLLLLLFAVLIAFVLDPP